MKALQENIQRAVQLNLFTHSGSVYAFTASFISKELPEQEGKLARELAKTVTEWAYLRKQLAGSLASVSERSLKAIEEIKNNLSVWHNPTNGYRIDEYLSKSQTTVLHITSLCSLIDLDSETIERIFMIATKFEINTK